MLTVHGTTLENPYLIIKEDIDFDQFLELANETDKCELIGGVFIMHSPASTQHEFVFQFLLGLLGNYVSFYNLGTVLGSRTVVKVDDKNGYEPDILFVSNHNKAEITKTYIDGSPDFIVEILSATTKRYDLGSKRDYYEKIGVKEYWVVDIDNKEIIKHTLTQNRFEETPIAKGKLKSVTINGFWINVEWLWMGKLPKGLDCLAEIIGFEIKLKK